MAKSTVGTKRGRGAVMKSPGGSTSSSAAKEPCEPSPVPGCNFTQARVVGTPCSRRCEMTRTPNLWS